MVGVVGGWVRGGAIQNKEEGMLLIVCTLVFCGALAFALWVLVRG